MTNYREILRLRSPGLNNTEIATSMGCSRNTVAVVLRRAEACGLAYPSLAEMSDKQIAEVLFPATASKPAYKMLDYEYVHKERQKDGATLNLLYCENCEVAENCRISLRNSISITATLHNKWI